MTHAETLFDGLAPYYDSLYADSTDDAALDGKVEFYVDRALDADGPVLEIGCGTGNVYLELLEAGVDAYGIDVSGGMLDQLRRKADEAGLVPAVRQADMRAFEPEREYELVLIPGRGFLHNLTVDDQLRTLRNVRDALADGGRLLCNFLTPNLATISEQTGTTERRTFERDGREYILVMYDEIEDGIAQVVLGEREIEDPSGEVVEGVEYRLKLVSRDEFELLLEVTGYESWKVYGGFDLEPLDSADQEMVWIARR